MINNNILYTVLFSVLLIPFILRKEHIKQNKFSGYAYYIVKPISDQSSDKTSNLLRDLEPFGDKISESFVFLLEFEKSNSQFTLIDTKELQKFSERSVSLAAIRYGYSDTIWQKDKIAYSKTYKDFEHKNPVLLKSYLDDPKWKITSEKKNIDKFVCYKATKTLIYKRGKKTFSIPMIAWFCPDIPVSIGPAEFGGLPGIILEVQTNKYLYGLKSIHFKSDVKLIPMPSLSSYTEEELINQLSKFN